MSSHCRCICKHLLEEKHTKISIYLQTPVNCLPSRLSSWINDKHSSYRWLNEPFVCICTVLLWKEHFVLCAVSQTKAWTVELKSLERGAVVVHWVNVDQGLVSPTWYAAEYTRQKVNLCWGGLCVVLPFLFSFMYHSHRCIANHINMAIARPKIISLFSFDKKG